jgi:ABC-type multidrug transport system fused ATPase/permease subunit
MTSVERVLEYYDLPGEESKARKAKAVGNTWPSKGELQFMNVSFKYDEKCSTNVLKELSFKINSGEKIGIVGRTGAGKSSIIQALFRMGEQTGEILIDQVNIQDLRLYDLRSRFAFIPVCRVNFKI